MYKYREENMPETRLSMPTNYTIRYIIGSMIESGYHYKGLYSPEIELLKDIMESNTISLSNKKAILRKYKEGRAQVIRSGRWGNEGKEKYTSRTKYIYEIIEAHLPYETVI